MSVLLGLDEIDRAHVAAVGGKGAHLGELSRIDGVRVPAGFCVTTDAFQQVVADALRLGGLVGVDPDDWEAIRAESAEVRRIIEGITIPDDLAAAVTRALKPGAAYAVRSSATAEDLPTASFAGQQDTYLNVTGTAEILRHIVLCWASLFTERAVTYRLRNGFDHRQVRMAVVVQEMVFPQVSGILFTADPVTGNRRVATVDAGFGLGEALVSGLVNPDVFAVRDGEIVARTIAVKERAVEPLPDGGIGQVAVDPQRRQEPALTDAQVVQLVRLGRRIEAHFGRPQDIEWCLADGEFQIVQSRPITTLFPVPEVGDQENHVYLSVGHQQMMTDPMKPLGLSCWRLTALAPMLEAGGRLFVDSTAMLASPVRRAGFLDMAGRTDPLTRDALQTILDRGDFVPTLPDTGPARPPQGGPAEPIETDPAIVAGLIERSEKSIAALRADIGAYSGPALFDFLLEAFQELKRVLKDPRSMQAIMAGMEATWWLNDHLQEWLGRRTRPTR